MTPLASPTPIIKECNNRMNSAEIMNDRKKIKDAFAGLDTNYYSLLSTTKNGKRWCISYYYCVTDENKGQDHRAIVNASHKQIAEILTLLNLHIKNYKITTSFGLSAHLNDIVTII